MSRYALTTSTRSSGFSRCEGLRKTGLANFVMLPSRHSTDAHDSRSPNPTPILSIVSRQSDCANPSNRQFSLGGRSPPYFRTCTFSMFGARTRIASTLLVGRFTARKTSQTPRINVPRSSQSHLPLTRFISFSPVSRSGRRTHKKIRYQCRKLCRHHDDRRPDDTTRYRRRHVLR